MKSWLDFFDRRSKITLAFIVGIVFIVIYETTNRLVVFSFYKLPLFNFEDRIPFLLWTLPIYLSSYVQLPVAIWRLEKNKVGKFVFTALALVVFNNLIFFIFPTTYPRPIINLNSSEILAFLYNITISLDMPNNCFPSLHVAMASLTALVFLKEKFRTGIIFAVWSSLIIISTLTTKQHYAIDLVGGIFEAGVFFGLYIKLGQRYN